MKLRGRVQTPDRSRGRTVATRARGDTTGLHGPLQRLLEGGEVGAKTRGVIQANFFI